GANVMSWDTRVVQGKSLECPDPQRVLGTIQRSCLSALVTDRAIKGWYHATTARMTPNRGVTWQATSDDENSWPRSAARQPRGRSRHARSSASGCGASACS